MGLISLTLRSVGLSGTGEHVTPSPVKPVTHVQVYEPYMKGNKKATVDIVVQPNSGIQ